MKAELVKPILDYGRRKVRGVRCRKCLCWLKSSIVTFNIIEKLPNCLFSLNLMLPRHRCVLRNLEFLVWITKIHLSYSYFQMCSGLSQLDASMALACCLKLGISCFVSYFFLFVYDFLVLYYWFDSFWTLSLVLSHLLKNQENRHPRWPGSKMADVYVLWR